MSPGIAFHILKSALLFVVSYTVWSLANSPLRHIPGPILARLTDAWRMYDVWKGWADETQLRLHRRYGSVVRLGPKFVSISDPRMMGKIYATRGLFRKASILVWARSIV